MKVVVIVTPAPIPDETMPTIVGDRLLEALCEGTTRYNYEAMRVGMMPNDHPYSDKFGLVYRRDPRSLGVLDIDGVKRTANEYWAVAPTVLERGGDDCETLSAYLAAWYRYVCNVNASCAIYPSIVAPNGVVGRHVVVWVPLAEPLYTVGPFGGRSLIRRVFPGKGYIEDPSQALGMSYVLRGAKPPIRNKFQIDNREAAIMADRLKVPYLPAHWIENE